MDSESLRGKEANIQLSGWVKFCEQNVGQESADRGRNGPNPCGDPEKVTPNCTMTLDRGRSRDGWVCSWGAGGCPRHSDPHCPSPQPPPIPIFRLLRVDSCQRLEPPHCAVSFPRNVQGERRGRGHQQPTRSTGICFARLALLSLPTPSFSRQFWVGLDDVIKSLCNRLASRRWVGTRNPHYHGYCPPERRPGTLPPSCSLPAFPNPTPTFLVSTTSRDVTRSSRLGNRTARSTRGNGGLGRGAIVPDPPGRPAGREVPRPRDPCTLFGSGFWHSHVRKKFQPAIRKRPRRNGPPANTADPPEGKWTRAAGGRLSHSPPSPFDGVDSKSIVRATC
eukprot:m.319942 g.319942  ORF g.319942 m.319942 type:complete len:335 (+) comp16448_c0_seq22:1525-2529(+)